MSNKYVTPKQLEDAANNLVATKEQGGCYYWKVTTKDNMTIAIVLGWSEGWDSKDPDKDKYQDGEYRLATKIAYQPVNNLTQCDYEIDWEQPIWSESGEVCDTEMVIKESTDFESLAKDMNGNADYVLNNWRAFD